MADHNEIRGIGKMKRFQYVLLAILGIILALYIASYQSFPGYLDSDYYFGGGVQLAAGHGFTESYVWNYLDDPQGLPHPSHTYWMPLASVLSAAGMLLTGSKSYAAGRMAFIAFAGLAPVVTAALALRISGRRELAMASGLLAVFSIYYAPFLPVTDNYGPYLVFGGLFLILIESRRPVSALLCGILAGLLTLARSDGILWAGLAVLAVALQHRRLPRSFAPSKDGLGRSLQSLADIPPLVSRWALIAAGFLLITGPWFWRMFSVFGTLLAPGGSHLLWLRNYDETFLYPARLLTFGRWASEGLRAIIAARLLSLRWNLLNAFAAQGGIFLIPFVLLGIWTHRRDLRVRIGCIAWAMLLAIMSFVFPFAGARGGFFHSGAALQPLWWSLAPVGLEVAVGAARRRNLFTPQAFGVFRMGLIAVAAIMTAAIIVIRVIPGWGEGEADYPTIEAFLQQEGISATEPVMVRNPPGYYVMTGRPAVVVPYGDSEVMKEVAHKFSVRYLILEGAGAAGPIRSVYDRTGGAAFDFLGDIDGTRVFRIPR